MPGLIEQVLQLGLERAELRKDHPGALIGGARIPFPPKDMAGVISVIRGIEVKRYLALEAFTDGAVTFLSAHLHPEIVIRAATLEEKALRKMLRTMRDPVDLISLDGRDLVIDPETVWRYIQGGRDQYKPAFGQGAPTDYGLPKLRPGGYLIVNLAHAGAREVWCQARSRHQQVYQSPFVGVARVSSV